jgi:hypothetical protein
MSPSSLDAHLDVVMQHLSDLMFAAAAWLDATQAHLYSFWTHLDHMMSLLPLPQLSVREVRACLNEMWCQLEMLEQVIFNADESYHLVKIRQALIDMTPLVDDLLCSQFEFPAAHITSQPQARHLNLQGLFEKDVLNG